MVPVSQLEEVEALLKRNRVQYSVDENAVSLNGEPESAVINLGRGRMRRLCRQSSTA